MTENPAAGAEPELPVLVERSGPTLVITVNRPRARNAVDLAVAEAIAAAVDELEGDTTLAAGILTGAGGYFSAGMDLKAFLRGESVEIEGRGLAGITMRPPTKPMIAAVEGPALAGGCEMVLACDLVVASEEATFGLPEVKRGLVVAAGGLIRLPRRIPVAIAMEAALTGDPLPATAAHRWGLVNHLTPVGGALAGAKELAARIGANGPLAVRASKRIIVDSAGWSAEEMWDRTEATAGPVNTSEDAREGAAAFAEKRAPVWRGV